MTTPGSGDAWSQTLAKAEAELQDLLADRPPPFFVQRQLSLVGVPQEKRLPLLQQIFPTVADPQAFAFSVLADSLACTQRDDVACLNRYFYDDFHVRLLRCTEHARSLLAAAQAQGDPSSIYESSELLGCLLVEQCNWAFVSLPLVVLRFDQPTMSEAGTLLGEASAVARERRDWFRWHRITANQARLGFFRREDAEALGRMFDGALALGQLCLDDGYAVDRAFVSRRDELLHMAGVVKFSHQDVTYPNLTAHIKSPGRLKPPPGGIRMTIESGKFIGNISLPLLMTMGATDDLARSQSLFMDWFSIEDRVQLWMAYNGKLQTRALPYRNLHNLANLDLLLRPSLFEVDLKPEHQPFATDAESGEQPAEPPASPSAPAERIAFVGPNLAGPGLAGAESVEGKVWVFRFPTLEVGLDAAGNRTHAEFVPNLTGVPWEKSLGIVIEDLLPKADDNLKHLVISADGPLALLPIHLAKLPDGRRVSDRYQVSYAPSVAYFSPAAKAGPADRLAVVLNSRNRLQGPIWELQRLKDRRGIQNVRVLDGFDGSSDALEAQLADCDAIHIATHGQTFTDAPDTSGIELRKGTTLTIRSIEALHLKPGCLVFLNACGSSRVTIRSRIQFSSIANAFLAAGAATVVATFWETDDVAAALLSDRFYGHLFDEKRGRLDSLERAIQWLKTFNPRQLSEKESGPLAAFIPLSREHPYESAEHWGQFALFGHW